MERVAALDGVWKSAYGFCVFVGLAPDDSPLISCRHYDPDIYAMDWEMQ